MNINYISRIEDVIWFRSKFQKVLVSGEKTGTLRLGRRIPQLEILPVMLTETHKCIGQARIEVLAWLRFAEIVDYPIILQREYPHEYNQIWVEMRQVYPSITKKSWVTFYGFTME